MTEAERAWRSDYRHPAAWDAHFPPLSMVDLFDRSAAANGSRPLIDFLGRHYSYAETLDGANRVAAGLAALGYGPGDRIGLFLPNVPHYLAAYYGILKLGATVVNFSPLYTVAELAGQVADSGTRLLFTISASALLPTALKVLDESALERLVVGSVAGALPTGKSLLYRLFSRKDVARRPADPRIILPHEQRREPSDDRLSKENRDRRQDQRDAEHRRDHFGHGRRACVDQRQQDQHRDR